MYEDHLQRTSLELELRLEVTKEAHKEKDKLRKQAEPDSLPDSPDAGVFWTAILRVQESSARELDGIPG